MSFTAKRWKAPTFTGDWAKDGPALLLAISEYWQSLERPDSLSISEAAIRADFGVQFPSTQVSSTDANRLDDFANNKAWTPTDASGAALVFTAKEGRYTKIGDTVFAWGFVQYPVTADGTASKIGGLPFTVANTDSARGGGTVSYSDEATVSRIIATNNATTAELRTSAGANITNATLSGDKIYFLIIYPQA